MALVLRLRAMLCTATPSSLPALGSAVVASRTFSSAADGPGGGQASERALREAPGVTTPAAASDGAAERQRRAAQGRRPREPSSTQRPRFGGAGAAGPTSAEEAVTQIHPLRLFYPGQTYKPEELVHTPGEVPALPLHRPSSKVYRMQRRTPAANAALYAAADFRRPQLLSSFVSDTGRLLPRRTTKVTAKVQRAVVAAIKTARAMAILPYTDRQPGSRVKRGRT